MNILNKKIAIIKGEIPSLQVFFENYGLQFTDEQMLLGVFIDGLTYDFYEDAGISKEQLISNLIGFIRQMEIRPEYKVDAVTIIGGYDKNRCPENSVIRLPKGSITSIVGPTGSGKSRLLADIEWLAQGDTPTGRKILINDKVPDSELRFSLEHKLVAQLSQNMNFVMDASVGEFIAMHAESRMVADVDVVAEGIIRQANLLAGERFSAETALTSLSGGQSRALMIADTAMLSTSPVVLIDEIENAGIDRKKALQLLVKNEKIILIATHDPILALMAEQRMVIKNGGIHKLITTSTLEKKNLVSLEELDAKMLALRHRLRMGDVIE